MTETAPEPDGHAGGEGGTDARLDRLEATVGRIEAALSRFVPTGTRADAQQRVERHLDAPDSIETQVRAELARAQREASDQQAAADEKETLNTRLARLEERPPAPPVKRATKVLGWGGGR